MADMTETLLSEVIVELRKNREEIEKGNRDPSLASSIKQNAGEIGNAILLAGRSERFAKEERTTEVDDEIVTSREDNTTMLQQILNAVTDTNKKTPSPSKKKSEGKQERSFIKKLLGPIAELPKSLKETFSFLTNEKGGLFDFGGFLGKVRLLSLLVALPFFLNSKIFEDMLFLIDKVIIPGFTKLNNFLKTNLTEPLNELGELLGLGELGDTIANLLLAAGGFALISSSFRKFLFGPKGFVALFLSPKNNIFSRISRFGRGIVTDTKGVERKRDATGKFTKIKRMIFSNYKSYLEDLWEEFLL